jgi:hypothetical protein
LETKFIAGITGNMRISKTASKAYRINPLHQPYDSIWAKVDRLISTIPDTQRQAQMDFILTELRVLRII